MAFRFGFANGDEELNADDGNGVYSTPNATETNVPPVREHGLKELVGKNISRLSSHLEWNVQEPEFQLFPIANTKWTFLKQCISYQSRLDDVGEPE